MHIWMPAPLPCWHMSRFPVTEDTLCQTVLVLDPSCVNSQSRGLTFHRIANVRLSKKCITGSVAWYSQWSTKLYIYIYRQAQGVHTHKQMYGYTTSHICTLFCIAVFGCSLSEFPLDSRDLLIHGRRICTAAIAILTPCQRNISRRYM